MIPIGNNKVIAGLTSGELVELEINTKTKKIKNQNTLILRHLLDPFHIGKVNDIDVCSKKPLIATSGSDMTIKIWNHFEKRLEYNKKFERSVRSLSFHPSGLHLAAALKDKVVIMNLEIEAIRIFKNINIRDSRLVKFSNGG